VAVADVRAVEERGLDEGRSVALGLGFTAMAIAVAGAVGVIVLLSTAVKILR
jgi:hypothetical protein